eukprot:GHVU01191072.1.p1 GENE.GHVU01191072.1~~GHVU01191072.1.p1  ORF type:complete len:415 (+),score=68.70 GHVU01191072.1:214-1458(+)
MAGMRVWMHVCMCVRVHICTSVDVRVYVGICVCVHVCMYVCMRVNYNASCRSTTLQFVDDDVLQALSKVQEKLVNLTEDVHDKLKEIMGNKRSWLNAVQDLSIELDDVKTKGHDFQALSIQKRGMLARLDMLESLVKSKLDPFDDVAEEEDLQTYGFLSWRWAEAVTRLAAYPEPDPAEEEEEAGGIEFAEAAPISARSGKCEDNNNSRSNSNNLGGAEMYDPTLMIDRIIHRAAAGGESNHRGEQTDAAARAPSTCGAEAVAAAALGGGGGGAGGGKCFTTALRRPSQPGRVGDVRAQAPLSVSQSPTVAAAAPPDGDSCGGTGEGPLPAPLGLSAGNQKGAVPAGDKQRLGGANSAAGPTTTYTASGGNGVELTTAAALVRRRRSQETLASLLLLPLRMVYGSLGITEAGAH